MTALRKTLTALLVLAVVGLAAACNDPKPEPPTPSSTTPTPSSTSSTPTTATLSPAEQDLKIAEQTVTRYWAVLDRLASDPKLNLASLATVARDQAISQWQSNLSDQRARGWKQVGKTTIASTKASATGSKKFDVVTCLDVSKVNAVDKDGKSVIAAGRPDRVQYTYQVEKTPDGFFVTQDTMKGKSC